MCKRCSFEFSYNVCYQGKTFVWQYNWVSWQLSFRFAFFILRASCTSLQSELLNNLGLCPCLHSKSKHWNFHQLEIFDLNSFRLLMQVIISGSTFINEIYWKISKFFSIFYLLCGNSNRNLFIVIYHSKARQVGMIWDNKWYNYLLHPLKVFWTLIFNLFI